MKPNPVPIVRHELFLVRLWAEGQPVRWRASARNIHTGHEVFFPNVERLFAHLQQHIVTRQEEILSNKSSHNS